MPITPPSRNLPAVPLSCQAALEQACVNLLMSPYANDVPGNGGMGLQSRECGRRFDGQPPATLGLRYFSVWGGGGRDNSRASDPNLDETFSLAVTLTYPAGQEPPDRWVVLRDRMETDLNRVRAAIHADRLTFVVCRAAAILAGFTGDLYTTPAPVGWCEGLYFTRFDDVRPEGPAWLWGEPDSDKVALVQTAYFTGARRVQNPMTMS